MRVDIMSKMRGVDPFPELWERRTTIELSNGVHCDLLSLPDLVLAKKTQRDKDWPMIRRLVEAHHFSHRDDPNPEQIAFWLSELRTSSLLIESCSRWPGKAMEISYRRDLLKHALSSDRSRLGEALFEDELEERGKDREYWLPLKQQLEQLRMNRFSE